MISKKTSSSLNLVAYHTGPFTHLDHLGVLCIELGIPLVVSDPSSYDLAKIVYPELQLLLIEEREALSFLAQHCDVLLGCGKYWASQLKEELFLFFGKSIRIVFCPHGNSDKGRTLSTQDPHPSQDIALFYGQQMYDLWEKSGMLKSTSSWLFSGNYRLAHYLKRKEHYDSLADVFFANFSSARKTIFYAPTWPDRENPAPVLQALDTLVEHLGADFQLLIKLHPFLLEKYPHLQGRYQDMPFIQDVSDFAPIHPLLARSDVYLGDFSSIGYDALAFDLPLYFLVDDLSSLQSSQLGKAGPCLQTKDIPDLYLTIHKSADEYKEARSTLYKYAFGKEKKSENILKEITEIVSPSLKGETGNN